MKTFSISIGRGLDLDVLSMVETRVGICSNSGGGKSHLMRLMAERVAGRIPVHIIDWEGDWYTLRAKVDALLVAKGADLAPQVHTAGKLARRLLDNRVSAIIDVSSLKRMDRLLFVASYIESLLDAPIKARHPTLIFIDEAHRFCPEVVSKGGRKELIAATHRARAAVIALMDSGRKRALGGVLATQRLSKVSKDAIGEANNIFIGRYAQDTDLKRVGELLGLESKNRDAPKTFEPGEFFAQGPALRKSKSLLGGTTKFRSFNTVTQAPKFGAAPKAAKPSQSMQAYLTDLATIPEEIAQEVRDLAGAQVRIRELKRELTQARKGAPKPVDPAISTTQKLDWTARTERAVQRALATQAKTYDKILTKIGRELGKVDQATVTISDAVRQSKIYAGEEVLPFAQDEQPKPKDRTKRKQLQIRTPSAEVLAGAAAAVADPESNGALGGGMRRIVLALASAGATLSRVEVAITAGLSPISGTFQTYIGRLKKGGYIDHDGKLFAAMDKGILALGDYEPIPTSGDELVEVWKPELGTGGIRRIFDALYEAGSAGLSKPDLAENAELEPSSGTFQTYIGRLRKKGLTTKGWPMRLHEVFFQ